MKSIISVFLFTLILSFFPTQSSVSASTESSSPIACPSKNGALHVEGSQLTDCHGNPVQLKGISTHGLAWFPEYVNEEAFSLLHRRWNVNVMRLAMYTAESGGYCTDGNQENLKSLIDQGVSFATNQDMYVIIDWHILSDHNPNMHKEEAAAFFEEISARYADHCNVLYEICNEPNGNTSWEEVKAYAEEIIPIIRSNSPDAVILIGTPNWSQRVDQAAADPITGYDNLMYTLHFYAATHKEDLRQLLTSALELNLPVFVSEYSICDASGNGALDIDQANAWIDLLDSHQISYVNWSLCNKAESAAILRSSCSKTSGFEDADLSPAGIWLYEMLTGNTVKTDRSFSDAASSDHIRNEKTEFSTDTCTFTTEIVNQWNSNGADYYQYQLTLTNTTAENLTGWAIDVPFTESITLSDGWNGEYSLTDEHTLHISSKDYNAVLSPGASIEDIGFIICVIS